MDVSQLSVAYDGGYVNSDSDGEGLPRPDPVVLYGKGVKGVKRPRSQDPDEDSSEEQDYPDLHEYFSRFDFDAADIIQLCRSYASYLARTMKGKVPLNKKK